MSLSLAATMSLVEDLRHRGEDFCLVTVIRTANATSAKAGAKAVVTGDGTLHGFVVGGGVQGAVTRTALAALQAGAPRLIRVRPKDDDAGAEGLELHDSHCSSGGTVDLFLEPMLQRTRIVICGVVAVSTSYRDSGFVVCPACSIAWGWKSPIPPDGGEGLAKRKGVTARWRLKEVWSKTAT